MITIKSPAGTPLVQTHVNEGCKRAFTLMQEDYILLKFSLADPATLPIGAYAETEEWGRFELTELYTPKRNTSTGAWDYELTLEARYRKWKNKIFRYSPQAGGSEASWSLTATLAVHMQVFLENLAALGYDHEGTAYTAAVDSSAVEEKAVCLTYENTSLLDALAMMAEAWDCEWWVDDSVIRFGRLESGDSYTDLEEGVNVQEMTAEGNRDTYATRIYAFGSDRNLPANYRPATPGLAVNGVVQKRLMLPEGTPCIDAREGMAAEEAVEAVVIFDDVYPRTSSAISSVSTVQYDEEDEDGNPTGETWNAYRFRIAGFDFREEYMLEGEDLKITFQSGKLCGMEFDVLFNPDGKDEATAAGQVWEIIRNEDYGRPLPDETLKPADGDTVVLSGWDSSKIASLGLIAAAEQELKEKAEAKMAQMKVDPNNYRCKMISSRMTDASGQFTPLTPGTKVRLVNAGCFAEGYRLSRIIGYEYDLARPYDSPVYVAGEKAATSRLGSLEEKLDAVILAGQAYASAGGGSGVYVIRTNDATPPSDANVFSALRSRREFLSRQREDTAFGRISFAQGARMLSNLQFGESFASGMAGIGGRVDKDGNGELESLILRSWLEVPEIRFNRAEVVLGDQWRAPGGGIVESVTPDTDAQGNTLPTGTVTLKLEEGEIGAVAQDDICKGYFHDFGTPSNNATADTDDSRGNTQFSGFCTVFFRITSVSSSGGGTNNVLRYSLRPQDARWKHSFHPFEAMHFVAYGNFNDAARQKSAYATRTYTRFLAGVNTWEFAAANIAMQFGDLSNLSVFGMDMAGYSAYLQNVYYSGYLDHVKVDAPHEVEVQTDTGDFFIPSSGTLTLTARVRKAWHTLEASEITSWAITRDTGDAASDAAWNAAHASSFAGSVTLLPSDVGATALNASALFTVTAQGTDDEGEAWSASRTVAVHTLLLPSTLSMRFQSEYGLHDTFISFGDTVRFQAIVEDGLRNDYTSEYDGWTIERHNGDSAEDAASDGVWNATRAAISASGEFSIEWSAAHDDLQAERATFIVTAYKGGTPSVTGTLSI